MRYRLLRLLPLLAAAALGLAGCGADADPPATADPTSPAQPAAPAAPTGPASGAASGAATGEVPANLAFTATTVGGEPFDGATLVGQPVVFWFWASWCPRCHAQAPGMLDLAEDVTVIGVAGLAPASEMQGFVDRTSTESLTHLADPDGVLWDKFGVGEDQQTLVALDAAGEVAIAGIVTTDQVRASLDLA